MKAILSWILENQEWLKELLSLILGLCAFVYTGVVHGKSKKRLTNLEKREDVEKKLIEEFKALKEAYKERSK